MKVKSLAVCIVLFVVMLSCMAFFTETYHAPYNLLRAEADEDPNTTIGSTLVDLTTGGDFASMPATVVRLGSSYGPNNAVGAMQLIFCGGSAASKTFTYTIYAWRPGNGPAEFVATGTGTLGTQAVVKYPHNGAAATSKFWAHALTVTGRWNKTVASTDITGNNEVAKLLFDFCGYEYIYVEITGADGSTGSEAGDVSVYWSYFG